ncbi:hypothetical protein [Aquimarina algiphila]|uniref:hypothetical protein n=1 Tax=Aquimarina algiphila TaxID=2047982 RepID=UPI002330BF71|nr:hypothetical protein [Aquimarina algiphila]
MLLHREGNSEINDALKNKRANLKLLYIEKLGILLILISGLMPFVHSFVEREILEEKLFGYPSIQAFLYSLGVHLCVLFIVIGVLMTISVANTSSRYKIIQNYLRYSLISPFVSGVFYLSWVFIPDVDYNLLAYIFLSLVISVMSVIIFYQFLKYINVLKHINKHRENVLRDGLSFLKSKLKKR